jgi:hypothetical protein
MTYTYRHKNKQRGTFWRHIFSVFIAGAVSKTVVAPLERVKLVLQVSPMLVMDATQKYSGAT